MPGPAAVGGSFLVGVGSNAGNNIVSRPLTQATNYISPTAIPGYGDIIDIYHKNLCSLNQLKDIARLNGFDITARSRNDHRLTVWLNAGIAGERLETLRLPIDANDRFVTATKPWPSIEQTLFLFNRQLIDERLAQRLIAMQTGDEPGLNVAWMKSRFEIPGPSDLIRFAVREGFTPELVSFFGYNKELPHAILPWMEKQGYGGDTGIPMPAGSTTDIGPDNRRNASWFDLYWWSHWDLPSNTQGYEMLHRLYPQSRHGPSPDVREGIEFTETDLEKLQKANDIPDYWRRRLQAISYSPLTRVDVRRMHKAKAIDDAGVYHAYRAIGYSDHNANLLTQWTISETNKANLKSVVLPTITKLEKYYKSGGKYDASIAAFLQQMGFTQAQIDALKDRWDLELRIDEVSYAVADIRRAFLEGTFSFDETRQALANIGLRIEAIDRYMRIWTKRLYVTRRYIQAKEAIQYYIDGIVEIGALITKLRNLRFVDDEIRIMIRAADQKILKRELALVDRRTKELTKQRERIEREEKRQLEQSKKESDAKAKEAIKETERNIRRITSLYTEKNIIAFYKQRLLSEEDVRTILTLKGHDEPSVTQWIETYIVPIDLENQNAETE